MKKTFFKVSSSNKKNSVHFRNKALTWNEYFNKDMILKQFLDKEVLFHNSIKMAALSAWTRVWIPQWRNMMSCSTGHDSNYQISKIIISFIQMIIIWAQLIILS